MSDKGDAIREYVERNPGMKMVVLGATGLTEEDLRGLPVIQAAKDGCELCHGERGGVPGNENVMEINGKRTVVCDYCHAEHLRTKGV